ncbi:MAG: hypothetical protein LBV43_05840 [Prevotella sp.]|jgi:hypothetical protein|nr:hypothetical protein [Prevotella sp.]
MKRILLALLVLNSLFIFSQNNFSTKFIPIVKYSPSEFKESIIKSFVSSDTYFKAEYNGKEYVFYQKTGKYNDGEISLNYMEMNNIIRNLFFVADSVFYLYIDRLSLPFQKYPGIVKNNQIFMIKNNDEGQLYPFGEFVVSEFGSFDKFKELYLSGIQYDLDFGLRNGLVTYDKDEVIRFLEQDYRVHETYSPNDTIGTLNKFLDMLDSFTLIEKEQRTKLHTVIYKQIAKPRILPKRFSNMPYFDNSEDIIILDVDISVLLPLTLSKQQYLDVMRKIKIYNVMWGEYLQYIQEVYPEFDKGTGNLQKLIDSIPVFTM